MRILVTGAGGLIGRELCGHLSDRGHGVIAVQHRNTALRRNDGRPVPASPWAGSPPGRGMVVTCAGDVSVAGLGLPDGLAPDLDLVVHCAALTSFSLAETAYEAVNVRGTANVLAFAGAVPVLHVSTAYVCGRRDGTVREGEGNAGHGFNNGYERSKAAAEALTMAAHAEGRRVAIARPSIVVGDSQTGAVGVFGSIYALMRLVAEGRLRTLPAAPGATLDLVPIDHVIGGLTDIAEAMPGASGRVFHLVSGNPVPVAALAGLAQHYPGLYAPSLLLPADYSADALPPGERNLAGQVGGMLDGYLQRDPRFKGGNLQALSGRRCPPTDGAFLRRLVDHCLATGYLTNRRPASAGHGLMEQMAV